MNRQAGQHALPGSVEVVDVHVGGDLHRIVVGGVIEPKGDTVFEKMCDLRDNADGLRKILLHEPRGGHPSLFADLVVTPRDPRAHAGFIIMELMGYPLISGTNTMSTAIALLETGRIPMQEGINNVVLEAPGGLIDVVADCAQGKVRTVTYQANTPSYIAEKDLVADVPGYGKVEFDIAWTGAFYPLIRAEGLGLTLKHTEEKRIVDFATVFIETVRALGIHPVHPKFGDEGPLSFAVMVTDAEKAEDGQWQRRVCCFEYPRNSVCRAPAGVPSTAAVVQLIDRGILAVGDRLRTISAFDTTLQARIVERVDHHGRNGFKVAVTGKGWITSYSRLNVDFSDPLTPAEGLPDILEGTSKNCANRAAGVGRTGHSAAGA